MNVVVPDEFQYLYVTDAQHPVLKVPHEALRQPAQPVAKITSGLQDTIDRMIRVMKAANGIGLAGPQLGIGKRIIVVAPSGAKPLPLINPTILESDGEQVGVEGCLSIPGLYGDVKRAMRVVVEAYDRKGKPVAYELEGLPARVVQHEIDHLDGVLFIDKVDAATLHWEHPAGGPDAE
ncbi:MAG: peptide deformylase [Fimbriimonadaceae bacterium]